MLEVYVEKDGKITHLGSTIKSITPLGHPVIISTRIGSRLLEDEIKKRAKWRTDTLDANAYMQGDSMRGYDHPEGEMRVFHPIQFYRVELVKKDAD